MSKQWDINWYICRADASDVEYARGKQEPDLDLQVGDELWRVPQGIGPLTVEHSHWAGRYIEGTEKQLRVAAAAPAMLALLRSIVAERDEAWSGINFAPIDSAASFLIGMEDIKEEDL